MGERQCPDGGRCHHDCATNESCWRVNHCGPLSDAKYPDNEWPEDVKRDNPPEQTYYCDRCFHIHGEILVMKVIATGQYSCPQCKSEWLLNRGQARHVVSLKLQHYKKLAEQLGVTEAAKHDIK